MYALIWIAIGLGAGWLASLLMRTRNYGASVHVMLGVIGGMVGGWVMRLVGFSDPEDWPRHALVSLFGAMLLIGFARRLRPAARPGGRPGAESTPIAEVEARLQRLGDFERRVLERVRGSVSRVRDPNAAFEEQLTFGQRVADQVARFGGSWTFIGVFLLLMLSWMVWNTEGARRFDPYPFILLNLMLSCVAALQAPVIMMSQNRQAAKDRLEARTDYEVNARAEAEINRLHAKLDELREREWAEIVELQRRQIELLEGALRRLGADPASPR